MTAFIGKVTYFSKPWASSAALFGARQIPLGFTKNNQDLHGRLGFKMERKYLKREEVLCSRTPSIKNVLNGR